MEAQSATTDRDAEFEQLEGALSSERAAVTQLKERLQKARAVEEQLQMQVLAALHLHRASVWLLHIQWPRNRGIPFVSDASPCLWGCLHEWLERLSHEAECQSLTQRTQLSATPTCVHAGAGPPRAV